MAPDDRSDPQPPLTRDVLAGQCEVEFIRAGGPGGQHRNKRYTGVRIVHAPTGVVGLATERRSQAQNLEVAWQRLLALLAARAHRARARRPTRPSRAARARRMEGKRQRGQVKALRRTPDDA